MRDFLVTLHDAHYRRLCLVVSVRCHPLMRRLVLFLGLFQLDLVDLDPHLRVAEPRIVLEFVRGLHFPTFRVFSQHPVLGACQRLECPLQFGVR